MLFVCFIYFKIFHMYFIIGLFLVECTKRNELITIELGKVGLGILVLITFIFWVKALDFFIDDENIENKLVWVSPCHSLYSIN